MRHTKGPLRAADDTEDNARLLAAAPDLLKACRVAVRGRPVMMVETRRLIDAAIAKATGEAPA